MPEFALYLIPLAVGVLGFGLGRFTASGAARARELESHLEDMRKDNERLRTELDASRSAQEHYRDGVADHFVGTADRLRDLALQYRAVYDHLAEGARELCPERFAAIESPMETDLLIGPSAPDDADDVPQDG